MTSPSWDDERPLQGDPEEYDSDVNEFQPDGQNPHFSDSSRDRSFEDYVMEALEVRTSEFDEQELSKAELYWNAANVSEMLTEDYENGNGYLMAKIGPVGANTVIIADSEHMMVHEAYDPKVLEGELSPFDYLDNTEYADELMLRIMDSEPEDLSYIDMSAIEEEWTISNKEMAEFSESIVVAPGLQEEYRQMAREQIENNF